MNPAAQPRLGLSRAERFATRWAPWLLVLTLLGYPLVALFASALNWDSTVASIPFRIFVLVLSVLMMLRLGRRRGVWQPNAWLLMFWYIYLFRLAWDLLIAGLPGVGEALVFFLVSVLIPSLAAGSAGVQALPEKRTAFRIVVVGGITCALAILMHTLGWGAERTLDPTHTGGRMAFEAVNPITLGHAATTTMIAFICLTRHRVSGAHWMMALVSVVAAGWVCLLAGSRGPIVSLAFCGVVYALATGRWLWIALLTAGVLTTIFNSETALLTRFGGTLEDASSLERLVIQGNAIVQFLGSPLFGSAYAELESMAYPHNLFIETAMALGILGFGVLLVVLVRTLTRSFSLMREGSFLQPLLLLQYFLAVQLSGSIWGAAPLWMLMALVGGVRVRRRESPGGIHRGLQPPSLPAAAP